MKKTLKSLLIASATTLTLAACQDPESGQAPNQEEETTENQEGQDQGQNQEGQQVAVQTDVTQAVENVENAVVTIINKQRIQNPFREFGLELPEEEEAEGDLGEAGTGSGAIYRIDGDQAYIFTNNHVVEGSDAIDILFSNGETVEAEIVGADEYTDLAVLAIDAQYADTEVEFGDSEGITLGEPAVAIGSPLGSDFALSVTSGVVSGVNRTVPVDIDNDGTMDWEMSAIQTDAAINPGNSGGPLVNASGQVIGINSMKISSNAVEGMGFSIPSNDAVSIIEELEANGEIVRPILGVSLLDINLLSEEQIAEITGTDQEVESGTVIMDVSPGTSADNADLEVGDIVVGFNGQEVENSMQLRQAVYETRVGDEVEIDIIRQGESMTLPITMETEDILSM